MDYVITGLIVLGALALVVWRAVRFVKGLVAPQGNGTVCSSACSSCPVGGTKGEDGRCIPPESWEV